MADRPSDAYLRGQRACQQGIPASENPYVSSEDLAQAWNSGWQYAQTFDELSKYIHARRRKSRLELDPDLREELWNLIKSQLSLSEIKSERIDGVIRREWVSGECARRPEQPAVPAHPCSEIDVSRHHCNTAYTKGVCGAGAARRRRRHDQDIPVGSSQSAVPYVHSAMASVAQLACHEYP